MVDRILVTFTADDDGGEDVLSWGQQSIWDSMTNAGSALPVGGFVAVPPDTPVDAVVAGLRFVMTRHQSLRTHVVTGEDGVLRQRVSTTGGVPLEVIDAGADDPAEIARLTTKRYYAEPFDYVDEWPIRMAAVCRNGCVTHVVAVYCHIAVDVHGVQALVTDLATMDPATGGPTGPVAGLTPLEQVRQQRSTGATRHSEAAVRYTEKLVRQIPAHRYNTSDDPRLPRWWQVGLYSRAAYLAGRAVAARNRMQTSPVLFAAFAVAFSEVTANDPAVAQIVVNNRFRPGLAQAVGPVSEACVAVVETGDSTFDEVVGRAWQAATRAAKHSYYDPDRMAGMLAGVAADRGEHVDIDCYFNDRRMAFQNPPVLTEPPTADEVERARVATELRWDEGLSRFDHTVFFHVNDVPDAFDFSMCADTHRLAPAEMAAMMLRVEDVLVTGALDPAARVRDIGSLSRKVASVEC
ncbi:MAG TPA: condensation domain-containing protein [Pseudonocardiaceae bacterium]|nr:condensation domain-containing protein [Pseudonocardiaceae bacterium]